MTLEIIKCLHPFLREEFKAIASNSKKLDLFSFQIYFDYPLLLSKRLFEIFDIDSKGFLTEKDYIDGFSHLYFNDTLNKINFFFNFFDYNKEGLISHLDIQQIITFVLSDTVYLNNTINEQQKNAAKYLGDYFDSKVISIKQMMHYLQSVDSSVFSVFYSFIYSKKTFTQNIMNALGKKDFNMIQFATLFFDSLLSPSVFKHEGDRKPIEFATTLNADYSQPSFAFPLKKDEDSANEEEEVETTEDEEENELNDLQNFEDDLIHIKQGLIPSRNKSCKHHCLKLTLNVDEKKELTQSNDLRRKNQISQSGKLPLFQTSNKEAFMVVHPQRDQKFLLQIIDRYIVVSKIFEENNEYSSLIPIKSLYLDLSPNSDKTYPNTVQLLSLFPNQTTTKLTFSFIKAKDKSTFISLVNSCNGSRDISSYYSIEKQISHGKMGDVHLGIENFSQCKVIIKTLNKKTFSNYLWEVEISKFIKRNPHKNVIKCLDVFDYYDQVIIIYEYIEFGSLFDLIEVSRNNGFNDSTFSLDVVNQMINGLEYLHSNGIIHRDIKPNNILVKAEPEQIYTIKFIDFGVSQMIFTRQTASDCVGTLLFIAPEIFANIPYSYSVDLWSLGIVIFYLQFGFMPFSIQQTFSAGQIIHSILTKSLCFPKYSHHFSSSLEKENYSKIIGILHKTLDKNQLKRKSCRTIMQDLCLNE